MSIRSVLQCPGAPSGECPGAPSGECPGALEKFILKKSYLIFKKLFKIFINAFQDINLS